MDYKSKIKSERGFIALVTMLVITAAALVLATSASFLGLGELQMGFSESKSLKASASADACMDEAILRLKRDSAYSGGSLNIGANSCTITIVPSGNLRTITAEGTAGDAIKKIEVEVDLSSGYPSLNYYKEIP